MSRCSRCGREVQPGATFCGNCGAPLSATGELGKSEPARSRSRWAVLFAAVAGVALAAGIAALVVVVLYDGSARQAQVTEPQAIASCLDQRGAVFAEYGDSPDAVTLAVDLTGQTSSAPGLYLYITSTREASRRVLGRLREIAGSSDIDVEDKGPVLLAYVAEPTAEQRSMVDSCLA